MKVIKPQKELQKSISIQNLENRKFKSAHPQNEHRRLRREVTGVRMSLPLIEKKKENLTNLQP